MRYAIWYIFSEDHYEDLIYIILLVIILYYRPRDEL